MLFLRWNVADALYVMILISCLFVLFCFVILGGVGKMGTPWGRYGEEERTWPVVLNAID